VLTCGIVGLVVAVVVAVCSGPVCMRHVSSALDCSRCWSLVLRHASRAVCRAQQLMHAATGTMRWLGFGCRLVPARRLSCPGGEGRPCRVGGRWCEGDRCGMGGRHGGRNWCRGARCQGEGGFVLGGSGAMTAGRRGRQGRAAGREREREV
jgi:hypothetical protein